MNSSELKRAVASVYSSTDVATCEAILADARARNAPGAGTYDAFMKFLMWTWVAVAIVIVLLFVTMGGYAWFFMIFIIIGAVILGIVHTSIAVARSRHATAHLEAVAAMESHVRQLRRAASA